MRSPFSPSSASRLTKLLAGIFSLLLARYQVSNSPSLPTLSSLSAPRTQETSSTTGSMSFKGKGVERCGQRCVVPAACFSGWGFNASSRVQEALGIALARLKTAVEKKGAQGTASAN